jgi:hypothetical protein
MESVRVGGYDVDLVPAKHQGGNSEYHSLYRRPYEGALGDAGPLAPRAQSRCPAPPFQALEIRLIGRKLSSIGTEQFRHELSCIELKGELR